MSLKRIEIDWQMGSAYSIFMSAAKLALQHQCDDVVFEFNGGMFSVSRSSIWSDSVFDTLINHYPREDYEVKL